MQNFAAYFFFVVSFFSFLPFFYVSPESSFIYLFNTPSATSAAAASAYRCLRGRGGHTHLALLTPPPPPPKYSSVPLPSSFNIPSHHFPFKQLRSTPPTSVLRQLITLSLPPPTSLPSPLTHQPNSPSPAHSLLNRPPQSRIPPHLAQPRPAPQCKVQHTSLPLTHTHPATPPTTHRLLTHLMFYKFLNSYLEINGSCDLAFRRAPRNT